MCNVTKDEFATTLKKELQKRNPYWSIQITHVPKVNGIVLTGLLVLSDKSNISPTIYLENFYKEYKAGLSLEAIVEKVESLYYEHNVDEVCFDVKKLLDFENVKSRLLFKVINKEKNKELLLRVPNKNFHDLVIVFYVLLSDEEWLDGLASVLVDNKMLEYWKCNLDEIYDIAFKNTRELFKPVIKPIQQVVMELAREDPDVEITEAEMQCLCGDTLMYYASNDRKYQGASILLYEDVLMNFAEMHGDFYILPSSLQELLFVPMSTLDLDVNGLRAMVKEINADCLEEELFLSNNVYIFREKEKTLDVVTV